MSHALQIPAASAPVIAMNRKSGDWLENSEIRGLLKQNLGYTAKQVSVRARHSSQYVTITIRDASVDIARVEAFAKSLSTWSMGMDDVVTGQSIDVTTTREVDAAHAAPFLEEAFQIAFELTEAGRVKTASNGVDVISQGFDFIVQRGSGRYRYAGSRDSVLDKSSFQLALAIARA